MVAKHTPKTPVLAQPETPARKHLATCASIGWSGRRCGTTYAWTPREAYGLAGRPHFRFRNAECERLCHEAWREPHPTMGSFFEVADVDEPDVGWSTRIDSELRKCPLVRWEAGPYRGAQLHRRGETDFYRLLQKRPDYFWHPVGRLLRITDAGRAIAKAEGENQ